MTNTLTKFLLARIAEDEETWRMTYHPTNPMGVFLLAECEAKRRIVDDWIGGLLGSGAGPFRTLQHLALPHTDHPDYREEWRP